MTAFSWPTRIAPSNVASGIFIRFGLIESVRMSPGRQTRWAPHALAAGEENRVGIDHLARLADRAFQKIKHGELAQRLEHDRGRHARGCP